MNLNCLKAWESFRYGCFYFQLQKWTTKKLEKFWKTQFQNTDITCFLYHIGKVFEIEIFFCREQVNFRNFETLSYETDIGYDSEKWKFNFSKWKNAFKRFAIRNEMNFIIGGLPVNLIEKLVRFICISKLALCKVR